MSEREIGMRVGALLSANGDTKVIRLLGYGKFDGNQVPTKGVTLFGLDISMLRHQVPQITLDNGLVVYGPECWWGPEDGIQAKIEDLRAAGWTVEEVTKEQFLQLRAEAAEGTEEETLKYVNDMVKVEVTPESVQVGV